MSKFKTAKRYGKYISLLALLLSNCFFVACYRVDVPGFGDAALRKAEHQVIEVNDSKQEKIPLSIRVSPNELSRRIAQTESKGVWEMWPADLSIPLKFDVDMAAFNKRALNNKPLTDAVIIIDPSHGSSVDLGSVGEVEGKAVSEREITIKLAGKLRAVLENLGAKVYLLREQDEWRSLHYRVADAAELAINEVKGTIEKAQLDLAWLEPLEKGIQEMKERNNDRQDLPAASSGLGMAWGYGVSSEMRQILDFEGQLRHIILISLNMGSSSQLSTATAGFETYYLDSEFIFEKELENMGNRPETNGAFAFAASERANPAYTYKTDATRRQLANNIYDAVVAKITQFAKNSRKEQQVGKANFTSLRESGFTSCAIQTGFISNPSDLAWMLHEENQNKLAQAISEGIYNYYCLSNWQGIEGLSRIADENWKRASDAYREKLNSELNTAQNATENKVESTAATAVATTTESAAAAAD